MHVSKNNLVKENVSIIDELLCLYIAVNRFLRRTSSFDRFLKYVFLLDQLLIGGSEFSKIYRWISMCIVNDMNIAINS